MPDESPPPPPSVAVGDGTQLILAAAVGLITGAMVIAFRWSLHELIDVVENLGHAAGAVGVLVTLTAPAAGGLLVGWLVHRVLRVHAGHGVPAVIKAVAADKPLDDWRMGAKAGTSILTIGFGGSAGPEGPIVELGAVVGSYVHRRLHLPGETVRTLIGCGAAAGISGVFNAPIAGVVFVIEVVMRDFSVRTLAPLMLSATVAGSVCQWALGDQSAIPVPPHSIDGAERLHQSIAPVLGLMCGLVGAAYIRLTSAAGSAAARLAIPAWLKPAVGGLAVGAAASALPWFMPPAHEELSVSGEGYGTIAALLRSRESLVVLAILFVGRLASTALTLGSGATGGAFAPALVLGALTGAVAAASVELVSPDRGFNTAIVGLMGMAGLVAATFQAPLSGLLITFRLAGGDYDTLLPLMAVVVPASWLAGRLCGGSIYELNLLVEGIDLHTSRTLNRVLAGRPLEELLRREFVSVRSDQSLGEMIDAVSRTDQTVFPVVDPAGACVGMVLLDDLRAVLRESQAELVVVAGDVARPASPVLRRGESLAAAWNAFTHSAHDELIVVEDGTDGRAGPPVGLVRRRDLAKYFRVS